ncbi:MAG: hypothetical protein U9O85_00170 [Euryarchaeota archaeon]|nr:hypothetical protein [Euryarchaeota archaeon]
MKYSEAKQGRTFVIRLEDGDILHEKLEEFARAQSINVAALIATGGADEGSKHRSKGAARTCERSSWITQ